MATLLRRFPFGGIILGVAHRSEGLVVGRGGESWLVDAGVAALDGAAPYTHLADIS